MRWGEGDTDDEEEMVGVAGVVWLFAVWYLVNRWGSGEEGSGGGDYCRATVVSSICDGVGGWFQEGRFPRLSSGVAVK